MNMILHGIEAPNIVHTNTLTENISDIQEKDRFDVVLANPPFGGKERPEVQQNFPIKTGETALSVPSAFHQVAEGRRPRRRRHQEHLPVEHRQRLGGAAQGACWRAAVCTPSWTCPADISRRGRQDGGAVLREGRADAKIWFYKLDPGRSLGKTNPLNDDDLKDFVALQAKFKDSENSWTVDAKSIDKTTYDLSVKNPNKADENELRDPKDIIAEMAALDAESAAILKNIEAML